LLLEHCQDVAEREWDEDHTYLYAEPTNERAIQLYLRLGYVPIQLERGPFVKDNSADKCDLSDLNEDKTTTIEPITDPTDFLSDAKGMSAMLGRLMEFERLLLRRSRR
jgi:ribosomal protein S18 acetylase RimI-like enzyme